MKKIIILLSFTIFSILNVYGQSWTNIGSGIGTIGDGVHAIGVDQSNGYIYAGGNFYGSLKVWDGSQWNTLSSLISGVVETIYVKSSNEIYVGGSFYTTGSIVVSNIAKWDGSSWSAVGNGLNATVRVLYYDTLTATLYAGGDFTSSGSTTTMHIAKFSGNTWTDVGAGTSAKIYSIASYNGSLYAGTDNTVNVGSVIKYDGSNWSNVGLLTGGTCYALANFAGYLYAGGNFSSPSATGAKWDGSTWDTMAPFFFGQKINVLYSSPEALYVGGDFTNVGLGNPNYIARITDPQNPLWSVTVTSQLTNGGQVNAITKKLGYVIAGGAFDTPTPGCPNISITSIPVGISEIAHTVVNKNFFPNPAREHATLTLNLTDALNNPIVKIYDMQSKEVHVQTQVSGSINLKFEIDLSNIESGKYCYVISTEGKTISSDDFIVK